MKNGVDDERGHAALEGRTPRRQLVQEDTKREQIGANSPRACSGDMYCTVPTITPSRVPSTVI